MTPTLLPEIETMFQAHRAPARLRCAAPLEIASSMLRSAPAHEISATTVVGVLGFDDVDAFYSLVADICTAYDVTATVKLQQGSYSVRLSRSSDALVQ